MSKLSKAIRKIDEAGPDKPDKLSDSPLMHIIDNATTTRQAMTQARYIQSYLSNGYNGKHAMLAANPTLTPGSATVAASQALTNPSVVSTLYTYLAEIGADIKLQLGQLASVAKGSYVRLTTYKRYDADGNLIGTSTVEQLPSAKDVTTAIMTIAKLTGQYDAMRAEAGAMSSELKRLYRKLGDDASGGRGRLGAGSSNEHVPSKARRKIATGGIDESLLGEGEIIQVSEEDASTGRYGASEGNSGGDL